MATIIRNEAGSRADRADGDLRKGSGAEARYERLLAHLDRVRATRFRARGDRARIDRAIGKGQGYVAKVIRRDAHPNLEDFFRILAAHDLDPVECLREAEGFSLDLYLRELEMEKPRQVRTVRERLKRTAPLTAEVEELRAVVEALDEERFSNHNRAEHKAFAALSALEHEPGTEELACECWGILGVINRNRARHSAAAYCLRKAFDSAICDSLRAKTAQKTCYLICDRGNNSLALEPAKIALQIYISRCMMPEAGMVLVDCALIHQHLGNSRKSWQAYRASLQLLPADKWASRFAAHQGLGMLSAENGRLDGAVYQLNQARRLLEAQTCDTRYMEIWLKWLEGEIHLLNEDLEGAVDCFERARDVLVEMGNPIDVAMVSLRLAKALWLLGEAEELRALIYDMASLLRSMRDQPLALAALTDFLCMSSRGAVDSKLLDGTYHAFRRNGRLRKPEAPRT